MGTTDFLEKSENLELDFGYFNVQILIRNLRAEFQLAVR